MAEKIISPGVFTQENDLSFLPQGISEIGAAIVGPTVKGPAFVPTIVESYNEFVQKFGPLSEKTYVPYTVQEYIQNSGRVTIVRVLGSSGYQLKDGPLLIQLSGSAALKASGSLVIAGTFGQTVDDEFQVTVSSTEYRFIATDPVGGLPVDNSPVFFLATGSNTAGYLDNLVTKINEVSIGVAAADGTTELALTASDSGTSGNSITVDTGSGTGFSDVLTLEGGVDASGGEVINVLHPTYIVSTDGAATSLFETSTISNGGGTGDFTLLISGSYAVDTGDAFTGNAASNDGTVYSCSASPTSDSYLGNVFGYSAEGTQPVYNYIACKTAASRSLTTDSSALSVLNIPATSWNLTDSYSAASTPFITSQKVNGNSKYNLFKLHALAHGDSTNFETKIGITNIRPAGTIAGTDYGAFTLVVRAVDQSDIPVTPYSYQDSDTKPMVLETFDNLTLDPDSPNYIARRIGDQYMTTDSEGKVTINGDYTNKSAYVRVEVDTAVGNKAVSANLVPFGFRAPSQTIPNVGVNLPSASYVSEQKINSTYNKKKYFGFDYSFTTTDNLNYLKHVPSTATTGSNSDFYLGDYNQDSSANYPSAGSPYSGKIDLNNSNTSIDTRKFLIPLQGGFDGMKPNTQKRTGTYITTTNTQGFDCSSATSAGTVSYNKALSAISNPDEYDINMIVTPGILYQYHSAVNSKAINICEERGDCFYVLDDAVLTANITTAVDNVKTLDTNYAATYYPWVKIVDSDKNKPIWVPPSVVLPGVIAYTDKVAHEWFAPAGLNRGGLTSVVSAYTRLTHDERDTLYEGRLNPIAQFPNQGVCVWGQKTLQGKASALDRINVRRLLIAVKKFIASSSRYLVFEQNTAATRNRFLNIVNPYLESIQQRQGLYSFKVVMDETNNTPDVIDRNIMKGEIYLQPAKTAEFIVLDFNILPTGASFPE